MRKQNKKIREDNDENNKEFERNDGNVRKGWGTDRRTSFSSLI
jgi:hypothetical protein